MLFGKKFDMSMVKTDWDKRPLEDAQLKQSAFETQVLLRMINKIKWIGERRQPPKQRIFLDYLYHSVGNFKLIDNRFAPDWNGQQTQPREPHREEFLVAALRQLQLDGYQYMPPNFIDAMT